jgi:hypothetical protein
MSFEKSDVFEQDFSAFFEDNKLHVMFLSRNAASHIFFQYQ